MSTEKELITEESLPDTADALDLEEPPTKEGLRQSLENPLDVTPNINAPKYIPIETIMGVFERNPNISLADAGKIIGISPQALGQRLKRIGYHPKRLKDYRRNEKSVMELMRAKIGNAIMDGQFEVKHPRDVKELAMSFGILHDRQHGSKMTVENVTSVHELAASEAEIIAQLKAIERRLEARNIKVSDIIDAEVIEDNPQQLAPVNHKTSTGDTD